MAKKSNRDEAPLLITKPLSEVLRLPAGQVDMTAFDPAATPGFPGDKAGRSRDHRRAGPRAQ